MQSGGVYEVAELVNEKRAVMNGALFVVYILTLGVTKRCYGELL